MNNRLCCVTHATRLFGLIQRGSGFCCALLFDQKGLQRFFLMLKVFHWTKPPQEASGLRVRRSDTRLSDEFSRRTRLRLEKVMIQFLSLGERERERAGPRRCAENIDLTLLFRFVHIMKVIQRV